MKVSHYFDKTENSQWLLITDGNSWSFHVVYSVPISARAGDIIQVSFESEITNPQSYLFQTGRFIILGDSATDTTQAKAILPAAGENLTPQVHHQIVSGSCVHTFVEDFEGFVNVVQYAISSAAGPGAGALVEQGYGRLDVLHFENTPSAPVNPDPVQQPGDGSVTLTAAQVQQVKSALVAGNTERAAALTFFPS